MLTALFLTACADPLAPAAARPFQPPASYVTWWHAVEACSGLTGDWRRIAWFTAPPDTEHGLIRCAGRWTDGCWIARHRIYLKEGFEDREDVVMHEMLHDLLQRPDHDGPAWTSCGV